MIITSTIDLRTYISHAFDVSVDNAQTIVEAINRRTTERPRYGDDWSEYLDTLTPEDVHSLYSET